MVSNKKNTIKWNIYSIFHINYSLSGFLLAIFIKNLWRGFILWINITKSLVFIAINWSLLSIFTHGISPLSFDTIFSNISPFLQQSVFSISLQTIFVAKGSVLIILKQSLVFSIVWMVWFLSVVIESMLLMFWKHWYL